jgi:hypothetical protein
LAQKRVTEAEKSELETARATKPFCTDQANKTSGRPVEKILMELAGRTK